MRRVREGRGELLCSESSPPSSFTRRYAPSSGPSRNATNSTSFSAPSAAARRMPSASRSTFGAASAAASAARAARSRRGAGGEGPAGCPDLAALGVVPAVRAPPEGALLTSLSVRRDRDAPAHRAGLHHGRPSRGTARSSNPLSGVSVVNLTNRRVQPTGGCAGCGRTRIFLDSAVVLAAPSRRVVMSGRGSDRHVSHRQRKARNRRSPVVDRRCRGPEPRPPRVGHRRDPRGQALALVHAALRHRRLRRRRERGEGRGHRQQAP